MMPEYKNAIQNLQILKDKCNEEAKRSEDELVRKYAEFLQGQKDFPENILQKRQNELQSLINNGIKFREETETLLQNAEVEMRQEAMNKLNQAIESVGQEQNLAFVLNTDNNTCPFINKVAGTDISHMVLVKLGLAKSNVTNVSAPTNNTSNKSSEKQDTLIQTADTDTISNDFLKSIDSSLMHITPN
jgi:outer membrane protein